MVEDRVYCKYKGEYRQRHLGESKEVMNQTELGHVEWQKGEERAKPRGQEGEE